jgi:hypothetical protein
MLSDKQQMMATTNQYARSIVLAATIEGIDTQVMIDSGATGLFVHPRIADQLVQKQRKKVDPYDLTGFNGSTQDRITRRLQGVTLDIDGHRETITMDICDMKYDIVLGMPWLVRHNPRILWIDRRVIFDGCSCGTVSSTTELSQPEGQALAESERTDEPAEFEQYYSEFRDIAEEKFGKDSLPEHQPWDHVIKLKDDVKLRKAKPYSLSLDQEKALKEYLDKYSAKGYIRKSQSKISSPILFVPKRDGGKRLCVDFRKVNEATIPNHYPLPRIDEMVDRLQGMQWFTAVDIRDAYYRIRMAPGEEEKTAFTTSRYGLWEYLVMPFGLANAPATFQALINDALEDLLGECCVAYLDDVLIFSKTLEEHVEHVRNVFRRLRKYKLPIKLSKCEFHKQSVHFLGMIVSREGLKMDPAKVEGILQWPVPKSVKEVQAFIGLANFYRRFIRGFSGVGSAMTDLTKGDKKTFKWTKEAQAAFERLKREFTTAPILVLFDPELQTILETDASDGAIAAVLTQVCRDGLIRPVAYFSRKLTKTEYNYTVHDKELYAIVAAFKQWKVYLMGAKYPVKVYSDHKNLLYWNTTKVLSQRQARWSEELSAFNFQIFHVRGKENGRADALSRRPDYMTGLKNEPSPLLRQEGEYLTYAQPTMAMAEKDMGHKEICERGSRMSPDDHRITPCQEDRQKAIKLCHDDLVSGHRGTDNTLKLLNRHYYWEKMKQDVQSYVKSCDICNKVKHARHRPYGLLQPIDPPEGAWKTITMDFITKLPRAREPHLVRDYDSILVVCDKLTKFSYFLPFREEYTAEDLAYIFFRNIFANHGMPEEIISDRDKLFTSKFWESLCGLTRTKRKLSTSFHPQTDGQTERTNQTLEQYLRCYSNYLQTDWVELLPIAQFCFNNHDSTTGVTPFYANYGFHPRFELGMEAYSNQKATIKVDMMRQLHEKLNMDIRFLNERMAKYANAKRLGGPTLREGDPVYLIRRNIKTKRPSSKLDHVKLGPFRIKEVKGPVTFTLELPEDMKIHPTFHKSLLEPAPRNAKLATSVPLDEDMSNKEYDVEKVLKRKLIDDEPHYLIKWLGYDESENSWEPETNLSKAVLRQTKKDHPEWFQQRRNPPVEHRQKQQATRQLMMAEPLGSHRPVPPEQ